MRIAVTGANGYIGSHIAAQLERDEDTAVRLVRKPEGKNSVRFVLGEEVPSACLAGTDGLVHCAYDFHERASEGAARINVEGTRMLLESCKAAGIGRIVLISSMAAFPGCQSIYGKAKLAIEEIARQFGAVIVRPGLVYGGDAGHLVGALSRQASKTRVLPIIGGGQRLYVCHVDDVARGVSRLCHNDPPAGVVTLASPIAVTFREFLRQIAGRKMIFIPVPYQPVLWSLRILESLHLQLGFHSDSLIGLMNNDPHPDFSHLGSIGFEPRPFAGERTE
jgi:nucleoside-diphosphate-sugar epimerase